MLGRRLLTAVVLIPLFVWATLWLPSGLFAILLGVVVSLAAWEWTALAGIEKSNWRCAVTLLVIVAMGLAYGAIGRPEILYAIMPVIVLWWVVVLAVIIRYNRRQAHGDARQISTTSMPRSFSCTGTVAGLMVLVPAWLALVALHHSPVYGPYFVLFLFVLIWVSDSGALFAGKLWGRAKLAPYVSPGKTWVGVIGELALALIISAGGGIALGLSWEETGMFVIICMVTVAFSIVGDLLESLYKRRAGVKNSGALLPGHGGVMDRIDSISAAAPLFLSGLLITGIPN